MTAVWSIGDLVEVAPRLHPGSNKQGGVGRVTRVHDDGRVDVKFTVQGGRESRIEPQHIAKYTQDAVGGPENSAREANESDTRRPRRRLSGRGTPADSPTTPKVTREVGASFSTFKLSPLASRLNAGADDGPAKSDLAEPRSQPSGNESSAMEVDDAVEAPLTPMDHASESDAATSPAEHGKSFHKGQVVQVASRTQPGMNKPGGAGRISKVNDDGTYNVKYILGGSEKNVHAQYISSESDKEDSKRAAAIKADETRNELQQQLLADVQPARNLGASPARSIEPKTTPAPERKPKKARTQSNPSQVQRSSTGASARQPSGAASQSPGATASAVEECDTRVVEDEECDLVDPAVLLTAANPADVARQQMFVRLVAAAFEDQRKENISREELLRFVSKGFDSAEQFSSDEFDKRLTTMDGDEKVMICGSEVFKI